MRISVCIPQYNRSAYLLKGLDPFASRLTATWSSLWPTIAPRTTPPR